MRLSFLPITCLTAAAVSLSAGRTLGFSLLTASSGAHVRWNADTIDVVVDDSMDQISPEAMHAVEAAFATWNDVEGAYVPEIVVHRGAVDAVGYRPGQENHSTVRFAPNGYSLAGPAVGITVVTYGTDGVILDADVILNGGPNRTFGVLPARVDDQDTYDTRYDVQNVLTHEAGHLLGLGEELERVDDTMYILSSRGETKKRDLARDDEAGIRSLYDTPLSPPGTISCAVSRPEGGSRASPVAATLAALGAVARWRRRARRLLGPAARP